MVDPRGRDSELGDQACDPGDHDGPIEVSTMAIQVITID